jgi:hypothetical protein
MTSFRDLDPWPMLVSDPAVLAIGWINRAIGYPTGETEPAAYRKLAELCRNPWLPAVSAGFHNCELCQYDGARMKDEVYIPGRGCIYVAPTGIVHYISAHWYRPPTLFLEAVLACPPMRSMEYKKAILENGGRSLVRASTA